MITGTVPLRIPPTPHQITEGVRVIGDHPYMLRGEESRWVYTGGSKRWYYNMETGAIELGKEES